jgi:hypothetical protein
MRLMEKNTSNRKMIKMTNNEELREAIAGIVREEIRAAAKEMNDIIAEVVREELVPGLRTAVRESIVKELGCTISDVHLAAEENAVHDDFVKPDLVPIAEIVIANQQNVTEECALSDELSNEKTVDAGYDQGLYLYGLIDTSISARLGNIGIDECEVYTIPYDSISAIVHDSPLEPYKSDNDETVKAWVKVHQKVMDAAEEKFGNIMPFGFDTIISPKDNATAKEALMRWLSDEHEEILRKMDKIKGKKEYGIQIFYIPTAFGERIEKENKDVLRMKEDMASKPPGLAYMYKQKLENIVKGELDKLMDAYFKNFYDKILNTSDEIKVEKVKKADGCMVMMMNLSVLAKDEKALGSVLDEIESEEGIKIHFTGPWQPYSFI